MQECTAHTGTLVEIADEVAWSFRVMQGRAKKTKEVTAGGSKPSKTCTTTKELAQKQPMESLNRSRTLVEIADEIVQSVGVMQSR